MFWRAVGGGLLLLASWQVWLVGVCVTGLILLLRAYCGTRDSIWWLVPDMIGSGLGVTAMVVLLTPIALGVSSGIGSVDALLQMLLSLAIFSAEVTLLLVLLGLIPVVRRFFRIPAVSYLFTGIFAIRWWLDWRADELDAIGLTPAAEILRSNDIHPSPAQALGFLLIGIALGLVASLIESVIIRHRDLEPGFQGGLIYTATGVLIGMLPVFMYIRYIGVQLGF